MNPQESTFSINKSSVPSDIGHRTFQGLVARALEAWSSACGATFRQVKGETSVDRAKGRHIVFGFVARSGSDSPGLDAYASTVNDEEAGVHTINFDASQAWSSPVSSDRGIQGIDLYSVTLHEVGHALGIKHEDMRTNSDVMHAYYVGRKAELSYYDIEMALKYNPPRLGQFGFSLPNCHLVPLGDYVYLFYEKSKKPRAGGTDWLILRSAGLRVWERFGRFRTPHKGRIFANRRGHDRIAIGILAETDPPQLFVEERPVQWQVPMVAEAPKQVSGTVMVDEDAVSKAAKPHLNEPFASGLNLVDGPHNYGGKSVWVSANPEGFAIHTGRAIPQPKAPENAARAATNFRPMHMKIGHIGDEALFVFWTEQVDGQTVLRFTRDATPGRFLLEPEFDLIGTVPGVSPDGDFGLVAINQNFYLTYLVKTTLHTVALEYDRSSKKRLKLVRSMAMSTKLMSPELPDEPKSLRTFFHHGRMYTAISTNGSLRFVQH